MENCEIVIFPPIVIKYFEAQRGHSSKFFFAPGEREASTSGLSGG